VLFPANFVWDTLGADFPTLMAINAPDPSTIVMWLTVPISVAMSGTSLWWTTRLLERADTPVSGPAVPADRTEVHQPV
jgi:hypothetical protein